MHVQIDKSRRNDQPTRVEGFVSALDLIWESDLGYAPIPQQHIHRNIYFASRVDDVPPLNQETSFRLLIRAQGVNFLSADSRRSRGFFLSFSNT